MANSPDHSYSIVKLLSKGSFGEVNIVQCKTSMKRFVMKEIGLQNVSEREQRAAFLEATLLATLHHRNIVPYVQTYLQSGGRLFILTEFCEGGDLYNLVRQRDGQLFEETQIVDWLIQICLGLKHLHDNKILHRDLKTKNIFLTLSGTIKVGDLGIARLLKTKQDMATTMIGTPSYMSPEIYCNKPYNEKCDVWSLGCCMYEIATLEQAFNALDLFSMMKNVLEGKVSAVPSRYSSDLLTLISSMLAHDAEERPSVGDVLLNIFVKKHMKSEKQKLRSKAIHHSHRKTKSSKALPAYRSIQFSPDECLKPEDMYKLFHNCDKKLKKRAQSHSSATSSLSLNSEVTIPDINGNGDGNDNSMQHFIPHSKPSELSKAISFGCTQNPCVQLRPKSENSCLSWEKLPANDSKENVCPKGSNIFPVNHSHTAPCTGTSRKEVPKFPLTAMSVPKTPKNTGEVSLDFLKNLSQAMKQSRAERGHSPIRFGAPLSTKLCLSLPSLSNLSDDCCLCSGRQKYHADSRGWSVVNREVKSSYDTWKHSTTEKSLCNSCKLDKCRNCANGFGKDSLPLLQDKKSLVLPKASDILVPRSNDRCGSGSGASPNDTNVDNGLIQQIAAFKKNSITNFAARQRRREKVNQSTITKSAPASVQSFPPL